MAQIDQHGTPGMIGARWWEIYENTFSTTVANASQCCYITLRAGSGVVFNNHHTGVNQVTGSIDLYEEDTGYPARYQIGRGKNQVSDPAYVWNNDASMPVGSQTPTMVQVNRDYYLTQKPNFTPYTYPHPLTGGTSTISPVEHGVKRQVPFSVIQNHFGSSLLLIFNNPQKVAKAKVSIYTVDGKKILQKSMNLKRENVVDVSRVATGIYFVRVEGGEGRMGQKVMIGR
jgi:hypothetical protein